METYIGDAKDMDYILPKFSTESGSKYRSLWGSPEKFVNHVKGLKKEWGDTECWTSSSDFYGTKTFKDALDLVENGWKEGCDKIEEITKKVILKYPTRKKPIQYGIVGNVPDVARAVSGNPLNMKIIDNTKASRRSIVTLVSNTSASCIVNIDYFINRAAVLAALIDIIESKGYACEVIGYGATGGWKDGTVLTAIRLKDSSNPLDINRIAFGVGHPAMFRRLMFADWCGDANNSFLGYGLGQIQSFDYSNLKSSTYVFPDVENACFSSEEKAIDKGIDLCINSLRKQGFKGFGPVPEPEPVRVPQLINASLPKKKQRRG
jgi:hypothetical protein